MTFEPPPIIVAEDDEQHAMLIEEACRAARLANPLVRARDGAETVQILESSDGGPMPALILLDVQMPRMTGLEVLQWIKDQPRLKAVPVVMLTSSRDENHINASYEAGARSYLVKPVGFNALLDVVRQLQMYWLVLGEAPEDGRGVS